MNSIDKEFKEIGDAIESRIAKLEAGLKEVEKEVEHQLTELKEIKRKTDALK